VDLVKIYVKCNFSSIFYYNYVSLFFNLLYSIWTRNSPLYHNLNIIKYIYYTRVFSPHRSPRNRCTYLTSKNTMCMTYYMYPNEFPDYIIIIIYACINSHSVVHCIYNIIIVMMNNYYQYMAHTLAATHHSHFCPVSV